MWCTVPCIWDFAFDFHSVVPKQNNRAFRRHHKRTKLVTTAISEQFASLEEDAESIPITSGLVVYATTSLKIIKLKSYASSPTVGPPTISIYGVGRGTGFFLVMVGSRRTPNTILTKKSSSPTRTSNPFLVDGSSTPGHRFTPKSQEKNCALDDYKHDNSLLQNLSIISSLHARNANRGADETPS